MPAFYVSTYLKIWHLYTKFLFTEFMSYYNYVNFEIRSKPNELTKAFIKLALMLYIWDSKSCKS